MRSQSNENMRWICHIKCHFSKFNVLYAMLNKRIFSMCKCLKCYINHVGISDIMQCDNGKEFKEAALMLLKNQGIKVINGRLRIPRTQGLMKQANGVMKDKIKRRIKVTGDRQWTQHLARVVLAMNIQGHDSLPYKMSPYEVSFGRKHSHRLNSLATTTEQQKIRTDALSDDAINKYCVQKTSNSVIEKAFKEHSKQESESEENE